MRLPLCAPNLSAAVLDVALVQLIYSGAVLLVYYFIMPMLTNDYLGPGKTPGWSPGEFILHLFFVGMYLWNMVAATILMCARSERLRRLPLGQNLLMTHMVMTAAYMVLCVVLFVCELAFARHKLTFRLLGLKVPYLGIVGNITNFTVHCYCLLVVIAYYKEQWVAVSDLDSQSNTQQQIQPAMQGIVA